MKTRILKNFRLDPDICRQLDALVKKYQADYNALNADMPFHKKIYETDVIALLIHEKHAQLKTTDLKSFR